MMRREPKYRYRQFITEMDAEEVLEMHLASEPLHKDVYISRQKINHANDEYGIFDDMEDPWIVCRPGYNGRKLVLCGDGFFHLAYKYR